MFDERQRAAIIYATLLRAAAYTPPRLSILRERQELARLMMSPMLTP